MATAFWIILIWVAVSLPSACFVGKMIACCGADDEGRAVNRGAGSPAAPRMAGEAASRAEA